MIIQNRKLQAVQPCASGSFPRKNNCPHVTDQQHRQRVHPYPPRLFAAVETNPHLEYKSNKHGRLAKTALCPGVEFQESRSDIHEVHLHLGHLKEEWKQ